MAKAPRSWEPMSHTNGLAYLVSTPCSSEVNRTLMFNKAIDSLGTRYIHSFAELSVRHESLRNAYSKYLSHDMAAGGTMGEFIGRVYKLPRRILDSTVWISYRCTIIDGSSSSNRTAGGHPF